MPQKKEINISAESSEKTDTEFPARVISAILGNMETKLYNESEDEALKTASMAAGLVVSRSGAGSSIPTWREVEDFGNQRKG